MVLLDWAGTLPLSHAPHRFGEMLRLTYNITHLGSFIAVIPCWQLGAGKMNSKCRARWDTLGLSFSDSL